MERPFQFIDCKMAERDEFKLVNGVQPTWALFYLKEGSFRLDFDGSDEIISAGDCVLFPDNINFTRSVLSPIVFVYIKFRPNPKCPFALHVKFGRIEFSDRERFLSSIHIYEELMDSFDPVSCCFKEHLLEDILLQIRYENKDTVNDDFGTDRITEYCRDGTVVQAVGFIRAHISEKLSVTEVCHAVGTNASTLNFRFHRELSCPIGSFITSEKIRLARRLLAGTTYRISDIAERCGYDNVYYFSSAFKKFAGITPSEHRNLYR